MRPAPKAGAAAGEIPARLITGREESLRGTIPQLDKVSRR